MQKNNKKSSFLIAGKHAVTEALKNPKRIVEKVYLTEDSKKNINRENQNYNLLKNVKIYYKTKNELDKMCFKENISHQGLVAEIQHIEELDIKNFLSTNKNNKNLTLVALENVSDPRNIGSIIRSAVAFNIDGLIIKKRSFPNTSKLLYKSSSGCMEYINIFTTSNLNTTLRYLKSNNFWVCGFEKDGNTNFIEHDWTGNTILLFGSEGEGLKKHTIKNSDFLLKIPTSKKVESLNIANSASVVFHHINEIKRKKNYLA